MGLHSDAGGGEAVIIFGDDGERPREMLYSEFEAVLDAVVAFPEFGGQRKPAAYIRIDGYLNITAAAFFYIGFDKPGNADKSWNLPLRHFADTGGPGPDLGAGPIRLTCRSQCSVPWHQKELWDPDMGEQKPEFTQLRQIVRANRLGIITAKRNPSVDPRSNDPRSLEARYSPSDLAMGNWQNSPSHAQTDSYFQDQKLPTPQAKQEYLGSAVNEELLEENFRLELTQKISKEYQEKLKEKVTSALKEHQLEIATLQNQHSDQLNSLKQEQQKILSDYINKVDILKADVTRIMDDNLLLKEKLKQQAVEAQSSRELFEREMSKTRNLNEADIELMKMQFNIEFKTKLEAETTALNEILRMREIELHYRYEQETCLRDQVLALKDEKAQLIDDGAGAYIEKLHDSGVNFVVYHPGTGHITVPSQDMASYLENAIAYVAEKCGVTEPLYRQWLKHFESPCCQANLSPNSQLGNKQCGVMIEKLDHPNQFVAGVSDRCDKHLSIANESNFSNSKEVKSTHWDAKTP